MNWHIIFIIIAMFLMYAIGYEAGRIAGIDHAAQVLANKTTIYEY